MWSASAWAASALPYWEKGAPSMQACCHQRGMVFIDDRHSIGRWLPWLRLTRMMGLMDRLSPAEDRLYHRWLSGGG